MSRWLKGFDQVSNLIEKLDDRVATVAEERSGKEDADDLSGIGEILSKRGLEVNVEDEVDEICLDAVSDQKNSHTRPATHNQNVMYVSARDDGEQGLHQMEFQQEEPAFGGDDCEEDHEDKADLLASLESASVPASETVTMLNPSKVKALPYSSAGKKEMDLVTASKEAQKEVRTLRKHVVRLNMTLEKAENEIAALREELGQAAKRMEKDRIGAKEEREAARRQKNEEIKALQDEKERALKEQKAGFEGLVATFKDNIAELENTRKKEVGKWNKEIAQALEREQEMRTRVDVLEDEKSVLLNQISTMQTQQAALASRVESLSQASDAAEARERDAEVRLDGLLSQHARQISQRQSREVELERTIQELNLALVATAGTKNGGEVERPGVGFTRADVEALEMELQSTQAQLRHEKERVEMLHQQLRDMSKESSEEVSSIHLLQVQYQRQVADLTLEVSRLHAALGEAPNQSSAGDQHQSTLSKDNLLSQQVILLSEEVVKLRNKLALSSGELKTLKTRVKAASERAAKAEDQLAAVTLDGIERAAATSFSGIPIRKHMDGGASSASIRAVMRLSHGPGDGTEQIGKVVDVVDMFAVTAGKYLRRNPWARAGFILYLMIIHMWTFLLLFFHAHNFETTRMEYGSYVALGPDALMEQHKEIADHVAATVRIPQQGADT